MAASGIGGQEPPPEVRFLPQPEDDHRTKCARCQEPFLQSTPWQDYCSHRFCDRCFNHLRTGQSLCPACERKGESYKVASELHFLDNSYHRMRNLKAKCSFDPPCGWVGEFDQLKEHESWCENRKSVCFSCGARVIWRQMKGHVTTECRHRRVTCHHCQFETAYSSIIEHERTQCQFYHRAVLQHISKRQDDVKKGLRMLLMATYKKLDSQLHLSNRANSNFQSNWNKAAGERRDCPQPEEGFQGTRVQLDHLKSKLEDLIRRTDAKDRLSSVDELREEIERIDEACEKLESSESFKDWENAQGPTVEDFGKGDLEKWKGRVAEGGFMLKGHQKSNQTAGERVERETAKGTLEDSGRTNIETAEPEKLLEKKEDEQAEVKEEKIKMGNSHGEEHGGDGLAKEMNGRQYKIKNEHGDFVKEREKPEWEEIIEEIVGQELKENVERTQTTEARHKSIGIGDEIWELDPERANEANPEKGNLTHKKQMNNRTDNGGHSCYCMIEKETCLQQSDSHDESNNLSKEPCKHNPNSNQINCLASSYESMEPALHKTKRKKKKNKKIRAAQNGDLKKNAIDSKGERNLPHPRETCSSGVKDCLEKIAGLKGELKVLRREVERVSKSNTNHLVLKLMKDQYSLEGRIHAIEERQNSPAIAS